MTKGSTLALESVTLLPAVALRTAFREAFDLDLANRVGNPLRGMRFARAQEDLRRRLREHGLGVAAVPALELTSALKPEHEGIAELPVLGYRRMELRQPLEARELVDDEPHGFVIRLSLVQAQDSESAKD